MLNTNSATSRPAGAGRDALSFLSASPASGYSVLTGRPVAIDHPSLQNRGSQVIRPLLALSGALFCGSISAFFLFVPPLFIAAALIATILFLLTGFVVLFRCGIQAELQPAPTPDTED